MREWLEELDWRILLIGCGCAAVFLCLVAAMIGFSFVFGFKWLGADLLPF